MAFTFWNSTAGRVRLLTYMAMTLCVLLQTVVLGVAMKSAPSDRKPNLQVASSASVLILCVLTVVAFLLYPTELFTLCLFEAPVTACILSAVLSFTASATSAFVTSLLSSIIPSILTTCALMR